MPRAYTFEEVKQKVSEISKCELLSTSYEGVYEPLRFRCSCGRVFEKTWAHFRYDRVKGCPVCAMATVWDMRRNSIEYVSGLLQNAGLKYVSGDYKNRKSKLTVECSCGHLKTATLNSLLAPTFSKLCTGCSRAAVVKANTAVYDAVKQACDSLGVELVSDEYVNAKSPLTFRCACGNTFVSKWDTVKHGKTKCSRCTGLQSKASARIEDWLLDKGIQYVKEKTFRGCKTPGARQPFRFDFYLPEYNCCIEYDGQQHFRVADFGGTHNAEELNAKLLDTYIRDRAKDSFCKERGIDLIRISFREEKKVESILDSKLIPRKADS